MTNSNAGEKTFSGRLFSEVDSMTNADGMKLFCKYWKPSETPKFLLIMVHGLGGHCARFEELALRMNEIGGFVFAHDNLGHGESQGPRTTVRNYEVFIRDINQHVDRIKETYPDLPVFLGGQSMGASLALLTAHQNPDKYAGVILLSGMLKIDPQMAGSFKAKHPRDASVNQSGRLHNPKEMIREYSLCNESKIRMHMWQSAMKFLIRGVAALLPSLQVSTLDESHGTRDKKELEIVVKDPLKSSAVKGEMAAQLVRIFEELQRIESSFSSPFIALHGSADATCDPEGSKHLFNVAKSEDKTLKLYDGCYHDLIHELPEDKKKCLDDIAEWVKNRL